MKLLERSRPHVLYADDDQGTLDVYKAFTQALGWTGDFVLTAREIIAAVNKRCCNGGPCYDALVCDVNFFDELGGGPRITGVTAVREIRAAYPDLPVIFVSGYSSFLVRDAVKGISADFYQKPVDFETLFGRIAYLIRWNRVVKAPDWDGEERRKRSMNTSEFNRRRTDRPVEVPPALETLISEVREQKAKHGQPSIVDRIKSAAGH
jgi:DNA-binding NtrC family response regulator